MSAKKQSNGSYEVLTNVKLDGKNYTPGDKISVKKADAESLVTTGVIGGSGSYKKSQAEAEVVSLGDAAAIGDLVKELKAEIQDLKNENLGLREQLAK